ncbi:DNA primase [Mucilaginibacter yixingensis]|uniref:DNA primase n=1 Tax=Mucilaginibacter yixingensis TaxID=1295612 RepID=A0A2T5JEV0_9SPHI|nr:DNA primase [Mucilaginibacter yixingensis]PTR00925.1 DNA primase [Mucilaginibacter yixingensis]
MITKLSIDKIMEATDIVEVVGEFVQLKKRGANYVGLSPFSNERTPSFTVSPAKGIFKCFSSGKGGSAITFLMELEKFTYPEALKWLAKKYGIEVEEILDKPENREEETRRESLMVATAYAAKFFQDSLWETADGQNIGLSYYKERAFTPETIRKFELGYSPDQWEAFSAKAIKEGYKEEFLTEAGLSVKRDNGSLYDRYRGRVMFPIHSITGRVIAFGGRTLKSDKSVPKYVNSPESDIYHKSNVLYGLYFAKKAIRDEDNCYLVEGYADVISVHQAGIENVVASSGTSLTVEQIRLIGRLTKNITILYDGDAAGIKASLRGLDLILEEGLNVKVVLFPDGNDPDSYVRQLGSSAFKKYIDENKKDFILFKTNALLKDAANDPIKRAGVIREVVESIAKIPDSIKASVFIKECSMLMQIDERALLTELNKMRMAKAKKDGQSQQQQQYTPQFHPDQPPPDFYEQFDPSIEPNYADYAREAPPRPDGELQEREIVRLLLLYGNQMIEIDASNNTSTYIGPFIVGMLDDVEFEHEDCKKFVDLYKSQVEKGDLPDDNFFIHQQDKQIVDMTIDMLTPLYILSDNWEAMHNITTNDEQRDLKATIMNGVYHLKKHKVSKILEKLLHDLQHCTVETDIEILQSQYMFMKKVERKIADELGIVILR